MPKHLLSREFCKIFKNNFFTEYLQWLLLFIVKTAPNTYTDFSQPFSAWCPQKWLHILKQNLQLKAAGLFKYV